MRTANGKLLAVLDAFTRERPRLTLSEIARAVGVPLPTAHRLVAELASWGGLERDEDGGYRVGLRIWELGALAPRGLGLREAALPFMEDLYEVTHENVQLAVREGREVLFVERFAARGAVTVLTQVGGRFALHPTGVGLVLLAHAPPRCRTPCWPARWSGTPGTPSPTPPGCGGCWPRCAAPGTRSATGRSPTTPSRWPRRCGSGGRWWRPCRSWCAGSPRPSSGPTSTG